MSWIDRLMAWLHRSTPRYASQVEPMAPFSATELVGLHNAERAKAKLPPLLLDPRLGAMAFSRAQHAAAMDLSVEHLHDGFDGVPGANYSAENAAMGQTDAPSVMASWMGSSPHRANILHPALKSVGCGRAMSRESVSFWFCVFSG